LISLKEQKGAALKQLAMVLMVIGMSATVALADDGIITKPSKYPVKETIERFQAAVKKREGAGFVSSPRSTTLRRGASSASI
jgi:hypothetical protein